MGAGECGELEVPGVAVDADCGRPLHTADVGERNGLAGAHGVPVACPPQLVDEVKAAARMTGIEEDGALRCQQGR